MAGLNTMGENSAADAIDPRQTPSFHIKRLAQELTRMAESELRPLGVGMGSLPVLTALKTGQASTQAELARYLHVEQPSMAQTLVRLERDGMIRKLPHASNKRVQLIELTEAAEKILPQSKRILDHGNIRALQGFTPDETHCLLALLQRMHGNLVDDADKS